MTRYRAHFQVDRNTGNWKRTSLFLVALAPTGERTVGPRSKIRYLTLRAGPFRSYRVGLYVERVLRVGFQMRQDVVHLDADVVRVVDVVDPPAGT